MNEQQSRKWLQVGELAAGFGGNELEPRSDLAGRSWSALFEGGDELSIRISSGSELEYSVQSSRTLGQWLEGGRAPYLATSLRPGIFLVDFLPQGSPPRSVSLVIDLGRGIGTAVLGRLPTAAQAQKPLHALAAANEELTPVAAEILPFALSGAPSTPYRWHPPTTDLVGRRMRYEYGPRDLYEHIYLNERYYTWLCRRGPEEGLADTDRCHYRLIDDELYLFVWREKIVPTLGVVLVDTAALRSTGKLFGYRGDDFGVVTNVSVGARASLVNVTAPPPR